MRNVWLITIAAVGLALPALAQRGPGGQPPGRGDDFGRGRGRGAMNPMFMAQRLARELNLTEEQQLQYDEILAGYRATWEEQGGREQMRALWEEERAAREQGDTARADELREQMRERGRNRGNMMDAFFTDIEPLLDEQQKTRLTQLRQDFEDRRTEMQRRGELRELMRDLPETLGLSEEQRAAYDELLAQQREQFAGMREQWQTLRPLMEEMRAARRQGDEQRVAELQAQIDAARPRPPGPEEFLASLEPILTEAQKAQLAEIRARFEQRDQPQTRQDVRQIIAAAKRLDLNEDQREQLKEITRVAQSMRGREANTPEGRDALAESVKAEILAILDANQANEFKRMLERGDRRDRQRRDNPRGQRPTRPDRPSPRNQPEDENP